MTTPAQKQVTEDDLFAELEKESKEYDRDSEIDRILKAFRLNAYAVLDLLPGVPEGDIKVVYRKKSLLIHPDKTKNPSAPEAFDRLKKAQEVLLDDKERPKLDEAIADARMLIIRDHKWTTDSPQLKSEEFYKQLWPEKIKEVLVENELRLRRQQKAEMREQGRQQRKDEEEAAERKRKREDDDKWEKTREERVDSWRDWQKQGGAAKKPNGKSNGTNGKSADGPVKKKPKKLKMLG